MNCLEILVERHERRLKRIDENPDPTKLRSNRLGYELDLDEYRACLEAGRQGKPFFPHFPAMALAGAMGAQYTNYEGFVSQFPEETPRYVQAVRSMGFPEYTCDYLIFDIAPMVGDYPPPSMVVVAPPGPCHVWGLHQRMHAEYFDVPQFQIDIPYKYNRESIKYLADQLGELIEFAESKVPGIKYDRDRHIELLEASRAFVSYYRKEWELRKHVPFPLDSKDGFRQPFRRNPARFSDPAKAVEYWRIRVEEIEERIARGVDREERLRLLWVWGRPVYMNPVAALESRGVSVPAVVLPPTLAFNGRSALVLDESEIGTDLSPLEKEARSILIGDMITGTKRMGRGWAEDIIWSCQEVGCDAIVYFQVLGCLHIGSLAKLTADMAEKEGIPTLILPGREMDATYVSPADLELRLTEFLDMVLAQKGRN